MTPVVIDASAGVELAADTLRGRALRALLPTDAVPWVPELFFVECGAVLRRWDLNRLLTRAKIDQAIDALMDWLLRVTQVRGLFADAWRLRANVTFADAVYVSLAEHLGGDCFLMMADWPTPLACRSGCCASGADGEAREERIHIGTQYRRPRVDGS